jgi:hypothetical protein
VQTENVQRLERAAASAIDPRERIDALDALSREGGAPDAKRALDLSRDAERPALEQDCPTGLAAAPNVIGRAPLAPEAG